MLFQKTIALLLTIGLFAFAKPATPFIDSIQTGHLVITFVHQVGDKALRLDGTTYRNATGETFTVTTFNYFVSNVMLTKSDRTLVPMPNQYFLIRQTDPASQRITLTDLPSGDYTALVFTVGVDSLKSVSPITERTGVLDPAHYGTDNMYWSWNAGYVFLKFEGTSPAAPARADGSRLVQWHVGGFGGGVNGAARTRNNLRTVSLSLPRPAMIQPNRGSAIQVQVDVAKLIDNTAHLSFAKLSTVHGPALAGPIANNYQAMFRVDRVQNGLK